jgi:transcription antitermination protein NusB
MARSRRKAREAALQTLYEIEVGKASPETSMANTLEAAALEPELSDYAVRLTAGVREHEAELDAQISSLIHGYDYTRLAAIDRNLLRIAGYELFFEPSIPPKVTINEAIEIAKKYSTAESGKFVNGVLGKLVQASPKAEWDPSSTPVVEEVEEIIRETPTGEVETIEAGSKEAEELAKVGGWKLRSE